jgi:hypothetical protein
MYTEDGFLNLYCYESFLSSAPYLRPISQQGFGHEFYNFVTDRQQIKYIFIVSPCILIHKIYFTPTNALFSYKDVLRTYLLTPWSTVLLEKLSGSAASQEIPRIFGTRRFLTVPTSARQLSLS